MKKTTLIISLIIGFIVLSYVSIRRWITQIDWGVKSADIEVKKIGLSSIDLKIPIWVYNPTPFDVIITHFNFNIYLNGMFLSNLTSSTNYRLISKYASEFPIMVSIPTRDLLKILERHGGVIDQPKWKEKVRVQVDGTFSAESGVVAINNYAISFDDSLKNWVG